MIAAAATVVLAECLVAAVLAILLLWWRGQVREETRESQLYLDECAKDIERQRVTLAEQSDRLRAERKSFNELLAASTERLQVERRSLVTQRNLVQSLERAEQTLRRAGLGPAPDPEHSVRDAALRLISDTDPTPPAGTLRPPAAVRTVIHRAPCDRTETCPAINHVAGCARGTAIDAITVATDGMVPTFHTGRIVSSGGPTVVPAGLHLVGEGGEQ